MQKFDLTLDAEGNNLTLPVEVTEGAMVLVHASHDCLLHCEEGVDDKYYTVGEPIPLKGSQTTSFKHSSVSDRVRYTVSDGPEGARVLIALRVL